MDHNHQMNQISSSIICDKFNLNKYFELLDKLVSFE